MTTENFFDNKTIFIDFDSSIVTKEGLDELAAVALASLAEEERNTLLARILEITNRGMVGEIGFEESLQLRIALLNGKISLQMINQIANELTEHVSLFFKKHSVFFKQRIESIYILSGGFEEIILPTARMLGIYDSHILANKLILENGLVIGYDEERLASKNDGKVMQVAQLHLDPQQVVVIGDGSTDRKVKENGYAAYFFAFTQNINRPGILYSKQGDLIANGTEKELEELMV